MILKSNYDLFVRSFKDQFISHFSNFSSIEDLTKELNEVFKPFLNFYSKDGKLPMNMFWINEPFELLLEKRKIKSTINLDKRYLNGFLFTNKANIKKYLDKLFEFLLKYDSIKESVYICLM